MKQIPLTQGKFALVDDEDYEYLNQFKWLARISPTSSSFYAMRACSRKLKKKSRTIMMHRVLLNVADPKTYIDHKDKNGLNNQRNNIRIATHSQNMINRRFKKGSSKYKGVAWHKATGKWQASIQVDKVTKYLGVHACEEVAARVYDKAAKELHGEFAVYNFA